MEKLKQKDVKVEHPLPHRPEVVKVELPDGRHRIYGDGNPYSSEELVAIQGMAESTTTPLEYTGEERKEVEAAEKLYSQATEAVARLRGELWEARENRPKWRGFLPGTGNSESEPTGVETELRRQLEDARDTEQEALIELNKTRRRVSEAAARRRDGEPKFHHGAPRSLDDRVAALSNGGGE